MFFRPLSRNIELLRNGKTAQTLQAKTLMPVQLVETVAPRVVPLHTGGSWCTGCGEGASCRTPNVTITKAVVFFEIHVHQ